MIAKRLSFHFFWLAGLVNLTACGIDEENQDRRGPGLNYSADASFAELTLFQYVLPDRTNFGALNVDPKEAIDAFYGSLSSQEGCKTELALSITREYSDGWIFEAPLQPDCNYEIQVQVGSRSEEAQDDQVQAEQGLESVYYQTLGKVQIKSEFYKGKTTYSVELPLQLTDEGRELGFL